MQLATTTGDFSQYISDQAEILPILKECGFTNVDYNFCPDYSGGVGFYSKNPEEHLKKVKAVATENSIKFVQAHAPMGSPLLESEKMINATLHCLRMSKELGIKNVVVHSGYLKGISKEECFRLNKEFFLPLLELAEQLDVYVLCENFNAMYDSEYYWIDSAADLREFLDFVNHPRLKACWDVGHGNLKETPQHEAIKILGNDLYALHIQDNNGKWDSHVCPYFGTLNLDSVMWGLREINFKGYFTFEVARLPDYDAKRLEFSEDTRLVRPPLSIKIAAEKLLYAIGEHILKTSNDW